MKIGVTFSAFDLLHAGHIMMLREARSRCDYLMVGLQTDPSIDRKEKNPPIQSLVERYTQLKAVSYVDEIIPYTYESEVIDILELYPIDIRIIGEDHRGKPWSGEDTCKEQGIEVYYNPRNHRFSSSDLRKRMK